MRSRGVIHWFGAAAIAVLAAAAGPVGAFYWYGPPEKTIINPPDKGKPGNPPEHHKHKHKPPPVTPPIDVPPVEPTPEPGTILGAMIGLGTLAASRTLRRRK
ncbi:MAG: PEP-CTERM sorting domain-containing protein [Planctomycetes bacterium]|nr:PEP-CTERM sorting domain-containing protein [Planctomycetota bacterium]